MVDKALHGVTVMKMAGYAKLFARILDSTVWREPDPIRILWLTMLAMADKDGVVHCTIPGLADRARITLKDCETGLKKFQQPDKYSWSKDDEGRRIREVDGGWFLINHAKYRALMSRDEQMEKTRIRVAAWREKNQKSVTPVTGNDGNDIASASTEAPTTTKAIKSKSFVPPALEEIDAYCQEKKNGIDAVQFWNYYEANGWKVGRNRMKNWKSALVYWGKNNAHAGKPDKMAEFLRKHGALDDNQRTLG